LWQGVLLVVLTGFGISLHVPGNQGIGSPERNMVFVGAGLAACVVYACGVRLALQHAISIWVVLGFAVLLRLLVLAAPPFLSTDLYRYVWDGRVQLAGVNPYLYVPAAHELEMLREPAIFPNINRPDYAVTIYPPVAQMIFRLVAAVAQSPYAIKAAMTAFDLITICVIMRLLAAAGRPPAQSLIYAWHPLPIWEFAGNGHVDAAGTCFIALGFMAVIFRYRVLASVALAAAVLVKFLPAVLMPVIWHRREGRWIDYRGPLAFAFVVAAAYACYAGAGLRVLGFLSGYAAEEGVAHTTRLFPLALLGEVATLPRWAGAAYYGMAATALLALGAAIAFRRWPPLPVGYELDRLARLALVSAAALTVALFPHYPWYFAWLLLPCSLYPSLSILYLTSAVFVVYLESYDRTLLFPCLIYGPFLALVCFDIVSRSRQHRLMRS
jgi:hypothetical protein